jgi:hypothetical protein
MWLVPGTDVPDCYQTPLRARALDLCAGYGTAEAVPRYKRRTASNCALYGCRKLCPGYKLLGKHDVCSGV